MTARKKKPLPIGKRSRQLVVAARKPQIPALEEYLEDARLEVEREALVTISMHLHDLFEDKAFVAGLSVAAGKKKLTERFLDDTALDIKERVLRDIARIYADGMY